MFEDSEDYNLSASGQKLLYPRTEEENVVKIEINDSTLLSHRSILDDLIQDILLELCFEVHREAKLRCKPTTPSELSISNHEMFELNIIKSNKQKEAFCYFCRCSKGSVKFTKHLADCISKLEGFGGVFARKAKSKAFNFKEYDSMDEDDRDPDDKDYGSLNKSKKKARGKPKSSGNSLFKPPYNSPSYDLMSYDEKERFFMEKCGVVTKRSKRRCMNTPKCTQHTEEDRFNARRIHREMNNEQDYGTIDVDTIDEESDIMPSYNIGDGSTSILPAYYSGSSAFP